ncbi:2-phosphosulfolactate phosphatase [Agromyces sp. ISL-38]|uniref:2-phosphosulfolactate phosphatase n=1 Tax=Agromyces sp. ISL-38 TaxID=2819107 RepID=UPI001BEA6CD7|nr:2-phosphosulfolactate phosphatase [Agromyces sp. ISL-38]MBT2500891.1 2-phosphosulfolactate phosphatase [Agromyces sp. ISL-38]
MNDSAAPFGQAKYQVRFDWGAAGGRRILPGAHVVVLVDALSFTTAVVVAAERGTETDVSDAASAGETGALALELGADGAIVFAASMRNRTAVAERILAMQEHRGERVIVAVVAAGEPASEPAGASAGAADGGIRFAIEDQLVAGAVIDALIGIGIDHTSPEAAVACASFEGLRHAATHLISASGSAVALAAAGRRDEVRPATERDVTRVVPELRDGAFRTEGADGVA